MKIKKMGNGSDLCSLCLCTIWHKFFEEVNDTIKEMVDVVFANRNLWLTKGQPICYTCSGKIKDSFNFKCMCIYTEEFLAPFSSVETITQNILKEAHKKKFGKINTDTESDDSACRLCLQLIKDNFVNFLEPTELDVLQECISEVTIQRTLNPIACNCCMRYINNYATFISDCIKAQEKRRGLSKSVYMGEMQCESLMNGINCNLIKTENYSRINPPTCDTNSSNQIPKDKDIQAPNLSLSFSISNTDSNHSTVTENEDDNRSNTLYDLDLHIVRQTDLHHENDFSTETDECSPRDSCRNTHKNQKKPSRRKTHICDQCDYQTTYLNALKSHNLKHMKRSDIHMYMCGKCEYKTKYRNALKSHELNHKLPSEIDMRECNQCSYKTKHRTALVLHMLKHKSPEEILMYKCDKCEFQTKFKHALKPHKLKHKKDK